MNWHIGQEIVAIMTHNDGLYKRGQDFIIKGLSPSTCKCNYVLIDVGIPYDYEKWLGRMMCSQCWCPYNVNGYYLFHEKGFAPLDGDISELTEILEQPIKQNIEIINK